MKSPSWQKFWIFILGSVITIIFNSLILFLTSSWTYRSDKINMSVTEATVKELDAKISEELNKELKHQSERINSHDIKIKEIETKADLKLDKKDFDEFEKKFWDRWTTNESRIYDLWTAKNK